MPPKAKKVDISAVETNAKHHKDFLEMWNNEKSAQDVVIGTVLQRVPSFIENSSFFSERIHKLINSAIDVKMAKEAKALQQIDLTVQDDSDEDKPSVTTKADNISKRKQRALFQKKLDGVMGVHFPIDEAKNSCSHQIRTQYDAVVTSSKHILQELALESIFIFDEFKEMALDALKLAGIEQLTLDSAKRLLENNATFAKTFAVKFSSCYEAARVRVQNNTNKVAKRHLKCNSSEEQSQPVSLLFSFLHVIS